MTFNFVGPTYDTVPANAEFSMNWFVEYDESGHGKSKASLVGTPGYDVFATLPKSPVRGIWAGDGVLYAVGGDSLYKVTSAGVVSLRGVLNSATTPAKICGNGNQLLVCSGDQVFCDNGAGPVSVLTDGYVSVTFLDGYFVALRNPTATNGETRDKIFVSALFDGTTWDPLDFASPQGSSDRKVQIVSHNQQLWIFGKETLEVWYNSGGADFPFERINGSQVEIGAWPWTIAELDGSLLFVGNNPRGSGSVYRTKGFIPERVSSHGVEGRIKYVFPEFDPAPSAYSYYDSGHAFYVLQSGLQGTYVFDAATGQWHQRGKWNGTLSQFDAHDSICQAHLYGSTANFLGSPTSGNIWRQFSSTPTYNGTAIRRVRRAPVIANEQKRLFFHRLQVDMNIGSQATGTPTAQLKWSDEGGHAFNSPTQTVSLGAPGNYGTRAIFNRLGSSRNRVFELTLPDYTGGIPVITEAYLEATGGNS